MQRPSVRSGVGFRFNPGPPYVGTSHAVGARVDSVPSVALSSWNTDRASRLDHLMESHRIVCVNSPGNQGPIRALNWSLTLFLAAEFQGFARELHDEVAEFLASTMARGNQSYFEMIRNNLTTKRDLDRANAKPETLTADFKRLGVADLWGDIAQSVRSGQRWRQQLVNLNRTRNAIAHSQPNTLQFLQGSGIIVNFATITSWRAACNGVCRHMDIVLGKHLFTTTGIKPW
jgi:hypothetical protein